jgi:hypothetical protein
MTMRDVEIWLLIQSAELFRETLINPVFRHTREGGTKARSALIARVAARRVSAVNNP